MSYIFGVFIVLHGLVHLLYFGQSQRYFELQKGLLWPDGSWALARLLGDEAARSVASAACVLAAIVFAAGGIGLLFKQAWWTPVVIGSAALSTLLYVLFWDGQLQRLPDKGAVGILINIAIVVVALIVRWPGIKS
jgi:hypothetical protein